MNKNVIRPHCTFEVDRRLMGVDVDAVLEVIRDREPTRVPHAPSAVLGLINLRGQVVTMIDLRRLLALGGAGQGQGGQAAMAVVLRDPGGPVGLVVDAIGEVVDVDESRLEAPPASLPDGLRRVARGCLADAGPLVVLDVAALLEADS